MKPAQKIIKKDCLKELKISKIFVSALRLLILIQDVCLPRIRARTQTRTPSDETDGNGSLEAFESKVGQGVDVLRIPATDTALMFDQTKLDVELLNLPLLSWCVYSCCFLMISFYLLFFSYSLDFKNYHHDITRLVFSLQLFQQNQCNRRKNL